MTNRGSFFGFWGFYSYRLLHILPKSIASDFCSSFQSIARRLWLLFLCMRVISDWKFFESVGAFFTAGDSIPWCDSDIVVCLLAVCFPVLCYPVIRDHRLLLGSSPATLLENKEFRPRS
ncbi:hypothetical protein L1887_10687 [Cichorium endivia]|nr:hypothetical protein L1887_10687 [Cichorium endivia]